MRKYGFMIILTGTFALSAVAHYLDWNHILQFFITCAAIVSSAALLGKATDSVAHYAGERMGGFLNATFGNATELIVAFFLVKDGFFTIVKASLTGAIIGNLLLVLGLSVLLGGLKYRNQEFNIKLASHNSSLMLVAVIALFVPAMFASSLEPKPIRALSLIVAGLLILTYLLWLLFSMVTHKSDLSDPNPMTGEAPWPKGRSILYLLLATVLVGFESDWLVATLDQITDRLGLSELFVGAFFIAIIGNAAEHAAAVLMALKNKMGAAIEIAVGSSLQIALFVAPILIIISFFMGNMMDIVFTLPEIIAIAVAVLITNSISKDGRTNWYEGVLLLGVYCILGIVFYMI